MFSIDILFKTQKTIFQQIHPRHPHQKTTKGVAHWGRSATTY